MRSLSELIFEAAMKSWCAIRKVPASSLLRASESPMGFAALAGVGVGCVLLLNIIGGAGSGGTAQSFSNSAESAVPTKQAETLQPVRSDTYTKTEPAEQSVESFKLRRNETLINLLERARIMRRNAHAVVNVLDDITNLRKLQRGQEIKIQRVQEADGLIQALWIRDSFGEQAVARRTDARYSAAREPISTIALTHLVEGTITDNLYLSAKREGLPDSVIIDLIRMMSFNVDFEREIRQGDTFQVYFERQYAPEFDDMENGRILHVDLDLKRRPVNATWFEDSKGNSDYFDLGGESTRRALMKTPLDVAVVTSRYGKRKHPVLGYTRMHKGVDFRAPTGTPIMAAGDGVIEMAARNGSYGNYIRIRHNDTYKTAYGHLSKFGKGIKRGRRVKQGQIIGYSGATGRVTAAHLHYEVLVSGRQSNPLTLKLPTGRVLAGDDLARFQRLRGAIVADINNIRETGSQLAAAGASIAQAQ